VLKNDKELKKAIFIFKTISRAWMVPIGTWLTNFSLKLHLPITSLMKHTIIEQICGAETQEEWLPIVKKIDEMNVHTVIAYTSEIREKGEKAFDKDLENELEIADFAKKHKKQIPFLAVKPSNLGAFSIWAKVSSGEDLNEKEKKAWKNIKYR